MSGDSATPPVRSAIPSTDVSYPVLRHWFSQIPPVWFLLFASIFAGLCFLMAIIWATRTPWLGVQLAAAPNGIQVVAVTPAGPSAGRLTPGDVLVSLHTPSGQVLPLAGEMLLVCPHDYPTYAQFNHFFAQYHELFTAITTGPITFELASGQRVRVTAEAARPLREIPAGFWLMTGISILVLQAGVGVWAFRRDQIPTRLLLISSLGYMILGLALAVYSTREWLLEPQLFRWLTQNDHLGAMIYGYSAMVLFWYYPRPLGRFPMASLFMSTAALLWLNELFQLIEWPLHTFALPYFPFFVLGLWFAHRQWLDTRHRPDNRAALQWMVRSALISISMIMVLYFLPLLFGIQHVIPFWAGHLVALGLYIGVVLGVLRFRLFDLERWWFAVWAWFFGGLLVVVMDIVLVTYTNMHPVGGLTLSLLVVGWGYFPLRQWLWSRYLRSPSQRLESLLPTLLDTFFATAGHKPLPDRWQALLEQVFAPLNIRTVASSAAAARLEDDGLVLAVPTIEGNGTLLLSGSCRGRCLFTRDDIALASLILTLARKSAALREAQERGAAVERERIARDLHDDVAPQLLTLTHCAESQENAERARIALQTLRESIYTLSEPGELSLETLLAEWRVEAAERTEAAGVQLAWQQSGLAPDLSLSARQRLNLARVFREALTNALRHAAPTTIHVSIEISTQLSVQIAHDGVVGTLASWRAGKGLNNMRTRIAELGGLIEWRLTPDTPNRLEVCWDAPLLAAASSVHHPFSPK